MASSPTDMSALTAAAAALSVAPGASSPASSASAAAAAAATPASTDFVGAYPRVDLSTVPNPCAHVVAVPVRQMDFGVPRRAVRFEDGWDYFRRIGQPRFVCAPMVNQSELPFRMLCRKYGTTLAYTPMFHAEIFGKNPTYRSDQMQVPPIPASDRPLVAQFCGNDPQLLLKAAKHVEHLVDAVDINLGCPQGIAKRGHYGSFLLEESQLLHDIVSTLHQHLSIPVTCKIRRLATDEATIALVKMLEEAGAHLITIHGRTRHQLKDKVGACDFDLIRLVKQNARVPVFANGGIFSFDDVQRCLAYTGVDGVMSSEALLCNPTLFADPASPLGFSSGRKDSRSVAREYLAIVGELEAQKIATDHAAIRAHLFKILYQHISLERNFDLRDELAHCEPSQFGAVLDAICARFADRSDEEVQAELDTVPLWYHRHQKTAAQIKAAAEKEARKQAEREALADADDGFSIFSEEECGGDGCAQ